MSLECKYIPVTAETQGDINLIKLGIYTTAGGVVRFYSSLLCKPVC